jgi:hypothetical protein
MHFENGFLKINNNGGLEFIVSQATGLAEVFFIF